MDALLDQELSERREADAKVNKRAPVVPKAHKEPKGAKRQAKAPEPEPEEEEDWDEDGEDDSEEDDEEDDELAENGSFTPTVATDPVDAAEAESKIDRRVFLDGVPRRSDLRMGGATILGWRAKKGMWEVECDRYDEHILVSSSCMFFMDLAPSPRKPEAKAYLEWAVFSSPAAAVFGLNDRGLHGGCVHAQTRFPPDSTCPRARQSPVTVCTPCARRRQVRSGQRAEQPRGALACARGRGD